MRVVNIDNLEWIQIAVKELEDKAILILKPHINDLDWFEAEPVRHGRWIDNSYPLEGFPIHRFNCSECNFLVNRIGQMKYCPNCGAKMDLKE